MIRQSLLGEQVWSILFHTCANQNGSFRKQTNGQILLTGAKVIKFLLFIIFDKKISNMAIGITNLAVFKDFQGAGNPVTGTRTRTGIRTPARTRTRAKRRTQKHACLRSRTCTGMGIRSRTRTKVRTRTLT